MKKYFCDRCGREVDRLVPFEVPCHISDREHCGGLHGHSDNEGNAVSGRNDLFELCRKCHNEVLNTAWQKFTEGQVV